MNIFVAFVLLIVFVMMIWMLEVKLAEKSMLGANAGARVSGPLFSMSASGTVGKAITFGIWKGRPWCRVWFKPQNPKTEKQVNVRTAMRLLVAMWQTYSDPTQAAWDAYADQFNTSGFNQFVKHGMLGYIEDLGSAVTPVSFTVAQVAPDPGFAWT